MFSLVLGLNHWFIVANMHINNKTRLSVRCKESRAHPQLSRLNWAHCPACSHALSSRYSSRFHSPTLEPWARQEWARDGFPRIRTGSRLECCHVPSQQPSSSSLIIPEESQPYPWCFGGLWDRPTACNTQGGMDADISPIRSFRVYIEIKKKKKKKMLFSV